MMYRLKDTDMRGAKGKWKNKGVDERGLLVIWTWVVFASVYTLGRGLSVCVLDRVHSEHDRYLPPLDNCNLHGKTCPIIHAVDV